MTAHTIFETGEQITTAQLPALKTEISEIVDLRNAALEEVSKAANTLALAYHQSDRASELASRAAQGRKFHSLDRSGDRSFKALFADKFSPVESVETFRRQMDASIWTHLLEFTGLRSMMDATAARQFDQDLCGDVTPATAENLRATFQTLMGQADLIFVRGIATAFSSLERRFKSHDGFKIGGKVILTRAFSEYSGTLDHCGYQRETIMDIERVFAKLDGDVPIGWGILSKIDSDRRGYYGPQQSVTETAYFRVRGFKNGNAHLWFTRDDLVEKVNKLLADYYGAVLPDAAEKGEAGASFEKRTNLPAKELQFYHSPGAVVDELLSGLYLKPGARVLEPSAGTGHIVRELLAKKVDVTAIEIHPGRVKQLRELEGEICQVIEGNFLDTNASPIYAAAVLNPPFFGTHWMDHVRHAWDFLEPGGQLRAVLPISAELGETKAHIAFRRWAEKVNARSWGSIFADLPPESFAEAGTRINTVILSLTKPK